MSAERIIGVDFGTSTSVIRVKRYEKGKPLGEMLETKEVVFGGSGTMVPTLIMKKNEEESVVYYGYEAQKGKKNFTNFHSFKVDLESEDMEKRVHARKLTEEFFRFMAKQYHAQSDGGHLGNADDKERTIISYPVKWSEETKQFMIEAAKNAGFPNVTGMDEAQAAIHAVTVQSTDYLKQHGLLTKGVPANVLLIDMGAGTTDLVLCRYTPDDKSTIEVLNTWPKSGDILFGGKEIDSLLQNFFREKMDEEDAQMVFKRVGADKFKSWKEETVSPALRKNDSVSDFLELDNYIEDMDIDMEEYCLDRAAFEDCLKDYLKQLPELINGCLQDAGMSGGDVDLVIVTGGHSQWYFVKEMLAGNMAQFEEVELTKIKEDASRIIPITRPQETVALGLVYSPIPVKVVVPKKPVVEDLGITCSNEQEEDEIVQRIVDFIIDAFKFETDVDISILGDKTALRRVRDAAAKVKSELAVMNETSISLKYICWHPNDARPLHIDMDISRWQIGLDELSVTNNVSAIMTGDILAPVQKDGKWGYIDQKGKLVISCIYDDAKCFSENLAAVKIVEKWGYIDKNGKWKLNPRWKNVESYSEGLAAVQVYDKWGYIDKKGDLVIPPKWIEAYDFSENRAMVKAGKEKWVGIDRNGKVVITALNCFTASSFSEGLCNLSNWNYFDHDGNKVFQGKVSLSSSTKYTYYDFHEGLALFEKKSLRLCKDAYEYGYVNKRGAVVLSNHNWKYAKSFSEGLAFVRYSNDTSGYIDKKGDMVIKIDDRLSGYGFRDGYARVEHFREGYGFIDKTGKMICQLKWDNAHDFMEGLAAVEKKGKWGFIDKSGNEVIPCQWDAIGDFAKV